MHLSIIMAGFGGQGILLMGQLLAQAAMSEGKEVVWLPSYGPEMRGGTANCTVIVSTQEIGSPTVAHPDVLVAMNQPSLDKFGPRVEENGMVLVNSTLVERGPERADVKLVRIPANQLAEEIGNVRIANMVVLGALARATGAISLDAAIGALKDILPPRRRDLIPVNEQALRRGAELVNSPGVVV